MSRSFSNALTANSLGRVFRLYLPAAAIFALAHVHAANAADPPKPDAATNRKSSALADTTKPVVFLHETLVTGTRYPRAYYESPQALSFLTRRDLLDQNPTVLGDALSGLPGVDMSKDSPWEQRPVLRGLSGQRVLVMMDGSPVNSARGNGPHPSLVDPSQVERVEVVRGPSSVAYGSDALGGAINIITREPQFTRPDERFRGSATAGGSSADHQANGYIELMPRLGNFSALLSSGARSAADFRAPDGTVPHSSFSDYNALANLRYDISSHMALKGSYQLYRGKHIGIPGLDFEIPDLFSMNFSFPNYDRDAASLSLEHSYPSSWFENTRAKVYWQRENRDFFSHQSIDVSLIGGGPPGARTLLTDQDRFFDLNTYGFQTQFNSRKFDHYRLSGGIDVARDKTGGDNLAKNGFVDAYGTTVFAPPDEVSQSVPKGNFDSYAGFAQGEWYVHPQWTVSAGARETAYHYQTDAGVNFAASGPQPEVDFQAASVSDNALSGSLGVVYTPRADLHLSANVANGYREPNAQDLFFSGPASVGIVEGNPTLKPEKSVSYDLGLRWAPGAVALSGNLFYSTYDDLIDAIQVQAPVAPGAPATFQYVNISKARIWGGETEGEWRLLQDWRVRASLAGAIGDITNRDAIAQLYSVTADQAPLPNVPPFKGSTAVRWTDPQGRVWAETAMRFSWRTNRLPLATPGVPETSEFRKEWLVEDVSVGGRLPGGERLVIGVRNIANRRYTYPLASLEEPGISFVGSLTTNF